MRTFVALLFTLPIAAASAPGTLQFSTHYLDPGGGLQNKLIVSGAAGKIFIISTTPFGKSVVHVTKTDSAGNVLAVFEFGAPDTAIPASAAVDASGNLLIGGTVDSAASADFPLVSPLQTTGGAFLTKLDPNLTKILYSTRLGAFSDMEPLVNGVTAITLDKAGNIYVTGNAGPGLPVTANAFQSQAPAGSVSRAYGFVSKISPDGSRLLFSTYYTGNSTSFIPQCRVFGNCPLQIMTLPKAIAVDATGNVIIAGTTNDTIPVTAGAFAPQCNCVGFDGFVAKLSPDLTTLEWGTYLPLAHEPQSAFLDISSQHGVSVQAIALDASGNVVLAGYAPQTFPTTAGALQSSFPPAPVAGDATNVSDEAGFVAVLDSTGSKLLHSTYFGGSVIATTGAVYSGVAGMAVDPNGAIWLTGGSATAALPQSSQPVLGQNYIAALTSELSAVSTLYAVPDGAAGVAISLPSQGGVAVVGSGAALLTGQPGAGPSILGVAPSVAFGVSDITVPFQLITIYGINIGPPSAFGAQIDPKGNISRSLGGVQVLFDGAPAALLYAGPNQINAIVPAATAVGDVPIRPTTALQVVTPTGTVDGPVLSLQRFLPEVFVNVGRFATPAWNQDGTINSASNPAPFGSVVTVLLIGIGNSNGLDNSLNSQLGSRLTVSVLGPSSFGGLRSLEVIYAGDAPQQASGISQVSFRLPGQKYNAFNYMTFEIEADDLTSGDFNLSGQFNICVK